MCPKLHYHPIQKKTLRLVLLFIMQPLFVLGQVIDFENQQGIENLFSIIFNQEYNSVIRSGTITLPGSFNHLALEQNDIAIAFQKDFSLTAVYSSFDFIIEGGIDDYGIIKINGKTLKREFGENTVRAAYTNFFTKIEIPNQLLKKGLNTIKIFAISTGDIASVEGDIYIQNSDTGEIINLNGEWDYKIYTEEINNLIVKPSHNLDVFSFYDFEAEKYTSNTFNDFNWGTTNFPNQIEHIFSKTIIDGAFWFRKKIVLDKIPTEDIYFNAPLGIDDADNLFVNGHLVGRTNCYYCPRKYRIPKEYLKTENTLTLLLVDNFGPGGINGPLYLITPKGNIDISKQWKFKQIFESQILLTIMKTEDTFSAFESKEPSIYNLSGGILFIDEIIRKGRSNLILIIIIATLFSLLIYLIHRLWKIKAIRPMQQEIEKKNEVSHIFIRFNRIDHKLEIDNILFIEGKKDYVKVVTNTKSYLVRKNLKTFMLMLPEKKFIRISKSVTLNVDKIDRIYRNVVYLKDGLYFKIGKVYLNEVLTLLNN